MVEECVIYGYTPPRTLTFGRCARALRASGVGKGDRVAGVMTNSQEALVCMLGTTAIGAVWRWACFTYFKPFYSHPWHCPALGTAGFSWRSASSVTLARVRRNFTTKTKVHAPCLRGDCPGRMDDDRIVRKMARERNTGTQETRGGEIEMSLYSYLS